MATDDHSYTYLTSGGGRNKRWYPHRAIETITQQLSPLRDSNLPWDWLNSADAAEQLPHLKAALTDLHRLVAMVERIAEGERPSTCVVCSSHFYPSRTDAKYCSGRCRTRRHRGRDGSDIEPNRISHLDFTDKLNEAKMVLDRTECGRLYLRPTAPEYLD
jgi:hypothetical protein